MNRASALTLDLATRHDGYMVKAGDPAVAELEAAGLVFTRPAGAEGYWIARAVVEVRKSMHAQPPRAGRPQVKFREAVGA